MTSRQNSIWFCVFALLITSSWAGEVPPVSASKASSAQDELFDSLRLLKISLEIGAPEMTNLKTNADNHAYVRCSLREGGQSLANVGVHCRGDTAKLLARGKPDFTLTFDRFVRGQAFHGHKRLLLQSSGANADCLGVAIAFELFRQAGVPAPRCSFAQLELNGRALGLYVINEGENRDFLRRHFGNNDGNLYDEGDTHDITGQLDKDHGGPDDDQSDVRALIAAAQVNDPAIRWRQLQQRLDLDRFLAFTAMEVLLWNEESYALGACKFRLYHDTATDRFVFMPKGIERVLEKTDGPVVPKCRGMVADAVLTTPEGQEQYRKTLTRLLDTVFVPDKVQERARKIVEVIRPTVGDGDPDAANAIDAAIARFQNAVATRARFVGAQLIHLVPAEVQPSDQPDEADQVGK